MPNTRDQNHHQQRHSLQQGSFSASRSAGRSSSDHSSRSAVNGCSSETPADANKSAELACCPPVASMVSKTIHHHHHHHQHNQIDFTIGNSKQLATKGEDISATPIREDTTTTTTTTRELEKKNANNKHQLALVNQSGDQRTPIGDNSLAGHIRDCSITNVIRNQQQQHRHYNHKYYYPYHYNHHLNKQPQLQQRNHQIHHYPSGIGQKQNQIHNNNNLTNTGAYINNKQIYQQVERNQRHNNNHLGSTQIINNNSKQNNSQHTSFVKNQTIMAHYKFHNDCQSSVLTYEQVKRLDHVMDQVVPIHGRGQVPTLYVKLKELIRLVKCKLQNEHSIEIRDVGLNGGAASYVLAPENSHYNDLDLVFGIDLSNEDRFDVIRDVVLECLMAFHPENNRAYKQQNTSRNNNNNNNNDIEDEVDCCGESLMNDEDGDDYDNSETIDTSLMRYDDDDDGSSSISGRGGDQSHQLSARRERSPSFESDQSNNVINEETVMSSGMETTTTSLSRANEDEEVSKIEDNIENTSEYESEKSDDGQCCQQYLRDEKAAFEQQEINAYHQQYQQQQYLQMPPTSNCAIKEAYVHKMVKVNDDDRWSLISLGVQSNEANQNCCNQAINSAEQVAVVTFASVAARDQQQSSKSVYTNSSSSSKPQQQQQQQQQQKQFPNSIELKFVDRMRRKFEFSVDSFQIILDSLIQFYDYAPQSTISIQKNFSSNLSTTMIDTARPIDCSCLSSDSSKIGLEKAILFDSNTSMLNNETQHQQLAVNTSNKSTTTTTTTVSVNNKIAPVQLHKCLNNNSNNNNGTTTTRGFYGLTTLVDDASNKIINQNSSSVASSSGCSSSSSVVSSSSSSLSCDEDQEDLYCEAYISPSSSCSTSSLLSSATSASILSASLASVNIGGNPTNSAGSLLISAQDNDLQQQQQQQGKNNSEQTTTKSISMPMTTKSLKINAKNLGGNILSPLPVVEPAAAAVASKLGTNICRGQLLKRTIQQQQQQNKRVIQGVNNCATVASLGANLHTPSSSVVVGATLLERNNYNNHHHYHQSHHHQHHHHHHHQHQQRQQHNHLSLQQCNNLIRKNLCDYRNNRSNNRRTSCAVISENFYPTVIGRSEYGNFKEALYHLEKKLIATRSPEEIRGGGLLKYCNLLVKNYKPTSVNQIRTLERYMCSRFFIDFSDLNQQRAKLESYLANHFSDDPIQKFDYLTELQGVVQRSTVCLMSHELRLTLNMIRELAYNLTEQQFKQQQQQQRYQQQQRQQVAAIQDHHHQQQQQQLKHGTSCGRQQQQQPTTTAQLQEQMKKKVMSERENHHQ